MAELPALPQSSESRVHFHGGQEQQLASVELLSTVVHQQQQPVSHPQVLVPPIHCKYSVENVDIAHKKGLSQNVSFMELFRFVTLQLFYVTLLVVR